MKTLFHRLKIVIVVLLAAGLYLQFQWREPITMEPANDVSIGNAQTFKMAYNPWKTRVVRSGEDRSLLLPLS